MKKCFTCESFNDGDFSHVCEQCLMDFNRIHKYTQYEGVGKRIAKECGAYVTKEQDGWANLFNYKEKQNDNNDMLQLWSQNKGK
jgi:hypothetical protein